MPTRLNLNIDEIKKAQLFWTKDPTVPNIVVKDLYQMEFLLFGNTLNALFYVFCITVFAIHGILGWQKLVGATAFRIPKDHQAKVTLYGWGLVSLIALMYYSFPVSIMFGYQPKQGVDWAKLTQEQIDAGLRPKTGLGPI